MKKVVKSEEIEPLDDSKPIVKPYLDREKEIRDIISKNSNFSYSFFKHILVKKSNIHNYYRVNFYKEDVSDSIFRQHTMTNSKFVKITILENDDGLSLSYEDLH